MRKLGGAFLALAILTFDTSMVEFLEIQRLPDDARRARFNLPASCDPHVSALVHASSVTVLVDCAAAGSAPAQQAPVNTGWPKTNDAHAAGSRG